MKLRRFTDAGIAKVRVFLEAVKESNDVDSVIIDGQVFTRTELISSPAYSVAIPKLSDIDLDETRAFDTTFAFCEYFDSLIHDHNPQAYREDVGFWTWLAMVYLPQLVKKVKGAIKIGAGPRLIYEAASHMLRHRHLLCYPFFLYNSYRMTPDICKVVLWHAPNVYNDLVEQLLARQTIIQNPAMMAVANRLYFDVSLNNVKRGAAGSGPGSVRRLVEIIDQFSRTRDFFDVDDSTSFLEILPKEFDRYWRNHEEA